MTTTELTTKITSLKELKRMVEEFETEITAIEDEIKAEMTAQGVTELVAGIFKVRWTPVTSRRFDTTTFKTKYADLYSQFTKVTRAREGRDLPQSTQPLSQLFQFTRP